MEIPVDSFAIHIDIVKIWSISHFLEFDKSENNTYKQKSIFLNSITKTSN